MGIKVIDKPKSSRRGANGRVYPYDKGNYTGIYRQSTDEQVKSLVEEEERRRQRLKEASEDPVKVALREKYLKEKAEKIAESERIKAEKTKNAQARKAENSEKRAVLEAEKAKVIATEKAEKEEFIKLSEKTDLDSLVLAYYKHLQNPKFLDFAISAVPQILTHLDENLSLNRYGETFFKHEKAYMDNMPKLVEKFGYNKMASLLYRAYLHSDIKYNKLLSETEDEKQQALLIWGKIFDDDHGLIRVSEFSKLDEDEKVALFKGLGKEFVEENKSRLISRYKSFIKALPKEFKNCTSILELQKEAQSVNKERYSNR